MHFPSIQTRPPVSRLALSLTGLVLVALTACTKTPEDAPLVVAPVARVAWEEVATLPGTVRGAGGFGSTGGMG